MVQKFPQHNNVPVHVSPDEATSLLAAALDLFCVSGASRRNFFAGGGATVVVNTKATESYRRLLKATEGCQKMPKATESLDNKKAVLLQGNRAMPQVFFSVEVRQQHSLQV